MRTAKCAYLPATSATSKPPARLEGLGAGGVKAKDHQDTEKAQEGQWPGGSLEFLYVRTSSISPGGVLRVSVFLFFLIFVTLILPQGLQYSKGWGVAFAFAHGKVKI